MATTQSQIFDRYGDNILGLQTPGIIITAGTIIQAGQVITQDGKEFVAQEQIQPGERVLLIDGQAIKENGSTERPGERNVLDRKTSSSRRTQAREPKIAILFGIVYNVPRYGSCSNSFFDFNTWSIDSATANAAGFYYPPDGSFDEYQINRWSFITGNIALNPGCVPNDGPNAGFDFVPNPVNNVCQVSSNSVFPFSADIDFGLDDPNFYGTAAACIAGNVDVVPYRDTGFNSWIPNTCNTCQGNAQCCNWPNTVFQSTYVPHNDIPFDSNIVFNPPTRIRSVGFSGSHWYAEPGACAGPPDISGGPDAPGFTRIFPGNIYLCNTGPNRTWGFRNTTGQSVCDGIAPIPDPAPTMFQTSSFTGEVLIDGVLVEIAPGSSPGTDEVNVATNCENLQPSQVDECVNECRPGLNLPAIETQALAPGELSQFIEYYIYWDGKVFKMPIPAKNVFANIYWEETLVLFNTNNAAYVILPGGGQQGFYDARYTTIEESRDAHEPFLTRAYKITGEGVTEIWRNDKLVDGVVGFGNTVVDGTLDSLVPYPQITLSPFSQREIARVANPTSVFGPWTLEDYIGSPEPANIRNSIRFPISSGRSGYGGYTTDGEGIIVTDSVFLSGYIATNPSSADPIWEDGVQLNYGTVALADIPASDFFSFADDLSVPVNKNRSISIPALFPLLPDTDLDTLLALPNGQFSRTLVVNFSINDTI